MAIYLTEADIGELVTMEDALAVLEEMFAARSAGEIVNRPRVRVPFPGGNYNVMPAGWPARGVVGHKSYAVTPQGASFQIVLYGTDGSGLLAVMSGGRISGLRTGAATGLAARALAGEATGGPVAVIGAGFQATAQVNGILAATGTTDVRIWSRSAERREKLVASMAASLAASDGAGSREAGTRGAGSRGAGTRGAGSRGAGTRGAVIRAAASGPASARGPAAASGPATIRAAATIDEALDGAPIVVVITKAAEPVLSAEHLHAGLTVIAAGNNTWLNSEIDPAAFARADLVVVDDLDNARLESGELMRAAELGHISWDRVVALGDIVGGRHPGRTSAEQVVVCELQGIGIEDVAVAERVYRRAVERGVGLELPA